MPVLDLIIGLIVIGVLLWLVNSFIPMDPKIKQILNIVVVIIVVLWLLRAMGFLSYLENVRVGLAVLGRTALLSESILETFGVA